MVFPMRLDVESLRAFRLIAENGGVTRAATTLCLSQSAVSHKIKRLESRVGRPLFLRRDGQLNLTEDGKSLFFYAKRILALHDEAVSSLKASGVDGEIRLGATENITLSGLTPFLHNFSHQHPRAKLSVKVEQSLVLQEWLKQGMIDVGLLQIEEEKVQEDDLQLWRDDLVWISSPDRNWAEEAHIPLITFGPDCFYIPYIYDALRNTGHAFSNILECPTHSGVFSAVASGLGISVINRRSIPPDVVEVPPEVLGELPTIAYVARLGKDATNEAIETLLECLPDLATK